MIVAAFCCLAALGSAQLEQQLVSRFGPARVPLLKDWLQAVQESRSLGDDAKLKRVNDFVNKNIVFEDDILVWQQSDYWATPLETIGRGRGDCEDFSIIKYISLRLAGIPNTKLRLVYVKARLNTPTGVRLQAHMVLAYYATPTSEPFILDNLESSIQLASKRGDLQPVFSFNSEGIFAGISGKDKAAAGGISRLSRWEDALTRMRAEGYE